MNAIDVLLALSASSRVTDEEAVLLQNAARGLITDDTDYATLTRARTARPKTKKKNPKREVPTEAEQAEIDRIHREYYPAVTD